MKAILYVAALVLLSSTMYAQYTTREPNPFHKPYHDSLKAMDYPYLLPLWGKKAYKKGFDLPFAWGIAPTFFAARQEISITKTAIGINDIEPVDMSQYIQFGKVISDVKAYTFRPDVWIFPFLNIYGVFGIADGTIEVPIEEPFVFNTTQPTDGTSVGVGFTIAGGLGGVLIILDNNFNWATTEKLDDPVPLYNFSARIGHNWVNPIHPDRNVVLWGGAFFQHIKADTRGNIPISDLLPDVESGKKQQMKDRLDEWLLRLPPAQHAVGDQIVDEIKDYLDGLTNGDAVIRYELNKRITGPWNLIFGAQYQHNKHWQIRTEFGAFGKRSQFMLMLNYRFNGFKRKQ